MSELNVMPTNKPVEDNEIKTLNIDYLIKERSVTKVKSSAPNEIRNWRSALVRWFSTVLVDIFKRPAISLCDRYSSRLNL